MCQGPYVYGSHVPRAAAWSDSHVRPEMDLVWSRDTPGEAVSSLYTYQTHFGSQVEDDLGTRC